MLFLRALYQEAHVSLSFIGDTIPDHIIDVCQISPLQSYFSFFGETFWDPVTLSSSNFYLLILPFVVIIAWIHFFCNGCKMVILFNLIILHLLVGNPICDVLYGTRCLKLI